MHNRFEQIQTDLCRVDRKVLHGRLQALAGPNSNPYALLDLYGPGHTVDVAGTTAYVTKCIQMEATKADYPNCTEEVPVKVGNGPRFADPFPLIWKDFPGSVPCTDVTPSRWKLHGAWYCASPHIRHCDAPKQLTPTTRTYRPLGDFTLGLRQTVFSKNQMAQHRAFQRARAARTAVMAKVTNAALRNSRDGRLGLPLEALEVSQLKLDIASFLFPWIPIIGEAWNWVAGCMLVCLACKVLVGSVLRVIYLYREHGCGPWLFASLWTTAFTLISVPLTMSRYVLKEIVKPTGTSEMEREAGAPEDSRDPIIRYQEQQNRYLGEEGRDSYRDVELHNIYPPGIVEMTERADKNRGPSDTGAAQP